MAYMLPFSRVWVLSCHAPNVKQVQLVRSGTSVSQGGWLRRNVAAFSCERQKERGPLIQQSS